MASDQNLSAKESAAERAGIEKVIHDSISWALNKDKERLFEIMAQEEDFFIFHPDSKSTVIGFTVFREMADRFWMKEAFKATDYAIRDLRITLSRSGTVAWYACYLDDHAEWNGRPIGWDNARWTGVVEKRDGKWVIVQMHFSFAEDYA